MKITILIFLSFSLFSWAQQPTRISILSQARDFDLSSSTRVKPFPVGAQLPSTCSQGEAYFRTDVAAGQNLFACTSANVWSQQGFATWLDPGFIVTRSTANTLAIGSDCSTGRPCLVRIGSIVRTFSQPATLTVSGSGTGTVYIFLDRQGNIAVGATPQSTLSLNCVNCTVDGLISDFPVDSMPLYQWSSSVASTWDTTGIDLRAVLSTERRFLAGNNITLTEAGSDVTISTTNFMPSNTIINGSSFRLGGTIPASANEPLLGAGPALVGGSANGTVFGINTPSGFSGDFSHWMSNGASVMRWGLDGSQTAQRSGQTVTWTGNSATSASSGFRLAIGGSSTSNQFRLGVGGGRDYLQANGTGSISIGHVAPTPGTADLLIQDATPTTGNTQMQIQAGEGQSQDLLQMLDSGGNVLTRITQNGALTLLPSGSRPTCNNSARGMHWFTAADTTVADKIEVCVKLANDTYSWTALF